MLSARRRGCTIVSAADCALRARPTRAT
jgi:hypothetical protein